jgi:DNA-binding response OmpR family regulator
MQDGKHVLLVVDDDPAILESLRVVLEANGCVVTTGRSAEQGLNVYETTRPDMLIVDLMMEELDAGVDFVKELRALGKAAPVYLLSVVGDNLQATADFSALGLTGVFQKPIDPQMLLSLLKTKLQ